jgi:hypothetical protein
LQMKRVFFSGLIFLVCLETAGKPMPVGGSVSGKVTYEGAPAKPKVIDMAKEPSCAKQHAMPPTTESVVTGPNNSLENVVVYISAGAGDEAPPGQAAKFEQKGCQYVPHVLAFQVKQTLELSTTTKRRTTFIRYQELTGNGTNHSRPDPRRIPKSTTSPSSSS